MHDIKIAIFVGVGLVIGVVVVVGVVVVAGLGVVVQIQGQPTLLVKGLSNYQNCHFCPLSFSIAIHCLHAQI